jgi:hypothetical protein
MEETQESDLDFWSELEHMPMLDHPSSEVLNSKAHIPNSFERILTIIPSEEVKEELLLNQTMQEAWEKARIEDTIQRIKEANQEYLKNIKITVRNQTKKELRAAVLEIQSQFQMEVITIKRDHDRMKEEISNKNREIYAYGQHCIDQHYMIQNHQMKNPEYVKVKKNKLDKEISKIKELISVFKIQLDAAKEITAEYSKEAQLAMIKVKEVDNEIQKINSAHQTSIHLLKQAIGSQEEELLNERNLIQEEFESFQNKISQEIEIRKLLDKRQQEFILKLQNEIKDAKIILQNPRMRVRVHEKLKEAAEEKNQNLPKITQKEKNERGLSVSKERNEVVVESNGLAGINTNLRKNTSRSVRNRAAKSFLF